jgi:hypothetical protein
MTPNPPYNALPVDFGSAKRFGSVQWGVDESDKIRTHNGGCRCLEVKRKGEKLLRGMEFYFGVMEMFWN